MGIEPTFNQFLNSNPFKINSVSKPGSDSIDLYMIPYPIDRTRNLVYLP